LKAETAQSISSLGTADFLRGQFVDKYVGIPHIVSITNTLVVILIPHMRPGRDSFGSQPEECRRVLIFTWMVTLKIASMVLDVLHSPPNKDLTGAELLQEVLDQFYDEQCLGLVGWWS
jgi:hypothetical protein